VAVPRYEPFGLVVTEALACGVPAITTAISGASEVYPDLLRPWVLPDPNDEADLAARIRGVRDGLDNRRPGARALPRSRARFARAPGKIVAGDIVAACEERAP